MFKVCTTAIVVGLTAGAALSVITDTHNLLAEAIRLELATAASTIAVPSDAPDAERLVQVANDLNIPRERLQALAEDAASEADLDNCIAVMIAVWGPAGAEQAMRRPELASNR